MPPIRIISFLGRIRPSYAERPILAAVAARFWGFDIYRRGHSPKWREQTSPIDEEVELAFYEGIVLFIWDAQSEVDAK